MAIDRGMMRLQDCALERAILGEERPVASQGKIVATYVRHDTTLMLFLLRQRMAGRYCDRPDRDPQPGSALYERIVADYQSRQPSSEELVDSINHKIERIAIRRREHAAQLEIERDEMADKELESYSGA